MFTTSGGKDRVRTFEFVAKTQSGCKNLYLCIFCNLYIYIYQGVIYVCLFVRLCIRSLLMNPFTDLPRILIGVFGRTTRIS